jgi:ankyrin repeat protein
MGIADLFRPKWKRSRLSRKEKALLSACENGDLRVVQKLLTPSWFSRGANVNARGDSGAAERHQGRTPLSLAIESGNTEVARTLIAAGSYVATLETAVRIGNKEMVELLIQHGAKVDGGFKTVKVGWGHTDSATCGSDGIPKSVKVRTDHPTSWSYLTWSREHGNTDIAELLIRNGADVNYRWKSPQ